jgi:hypothetical protein
MDVAYREGCLLEGRGEGASLLIRERCQMGLKYFQAETRGV